MIRFVEFLVAVVFAFSPQLSKWGKYLSTLKGVIARQRLVVQEITPGSPTGLPGLNEAELADATSRLEALGFVLLEDHLSRTYSAQDAGPPLTTAPIASPAGGPAVPARRFQPQGFARVMLHPVHGCFGKIIFVAVTDTQGQRPVKTTMPIVFFSLTGVESEDWTYATTNRNSKVTANALMKLLRRPRRLTTQIPDCPVEELLRLHLERRMVIAQAAGISWKRTPTLADDYAIEERSVVNIRAVYAGLSPLRLAWKLYRLKKDTADMEWLGELKGRLPNAR